MIHIRWYGWLLLFLAAGAAGAQSPQPQYTAEGLVNAASGVSGDLAPNTIATIYGQSLASAKVALTADRIVDGQLPTVLPAAGVRVLINGVPAPLYYASPTQVNFLVPSALRAGPLTVQLLHDSWAGPRLETRLAAAAPGLFQLDAQFALAVHLDGSVVNAAKPASPGEVVVLWATGLGDTTSPPTFGSVALLPAPVLLPADILIDGVVTPRANVLYQGFAPGYAGLYQINLRLPATLSAPDPEIRLSLGGKTSPAGVRLAAAP